MRRGHASIVHPFFLSKTSSVSRYQISTVVSPTLKKALECGTGKPIKYQHGDYRDMTTFVVPEGMPLSIFEDKYARKLDEGRKQTWEERVTEVVEGNTLLASHYKNREVPKEEKAEFLDLMKRGVLPMSGRHLQHGDKEQVHRLGENFTNCSTSAFSFLKFWLLMKGSGVGRLYDQGVCLVNWSNIPQVYLALSTDHPDWNSSLQDVGVLTQSAAKNLEGIDHYFYVKDSAEGWAEVIQILESAAFEGDNRSQRCVFDFSGVRGKGAPIKGQQNRPASGPVPFITAVSKVLDIAAEEGMPRWEQAMRIDHELAACVVVGGIRRSARIALKTWDDEGIDKFIHIKDSGELWSANNSVVTNDEFWQAVKKSHNTNSPLGGTDDLNCATEREANAYRIFQEATVTAYTKDSGEPAFFNSAKISKDYKGLENIGLDYLSEAIRDSLCFTEKTNRLVSTTLSRGKKHRTLYICNPCGEIPLAMYGGYCVIADVCAANANSVEDVVRAAVHAAKALVRVNLMPFLYEGEVKRTNRIGVGLTGIHEFAYNVLGLTWKDLVGPIDQSTKLWRVLEKARTAVHVELEKYCAELGVNMPSTFMTIKPSGTVSKVMNCTEGAHLSAYAYYMRWVMFPNDGEEFHALKSAGYPAKDVSSTYSGQAVIGFPTRTRIAEIMQDKVTLAGQATIEEQYTWLQRLERFWLGEGSEGGQVSYTLKFKKSDVSLPSFLNIIAAYQPTVRCCAIMPQVDLSAYAYQPEERITKEKYEEVSRHLDRVAREKYDKTRLLCEGGACPIELDLA